MRQFESVWKAMIALNIFLLLLLGVNLLLDANYFCLCGKPTNEIGDHVPSLLDYLGPWPWYILVAEFVALAHFIIAYAPFAFIKSGERKE
jgi:Predicted integral membrane protein